MINFTISRTLKSKYEIYRIKGVIKPIDEGREIV